MATLPLIAEQWSGVSPRWFLLLTFLISLSSCGVLSCDLTPGPLLPELFNTPRGVLGGLVMLGLQSAAPVLSGVEDCSVICLIIAICCLSDMGV